VSGVDNVACRRLPPRERIPYGVEIPLNEAREDGLEAPGFTELATIPWQDS
jgi:hypothetical protein